MKRLSLLSVLLVAAVGCGDDDGGGSYGDPIDNASAQKAGTDSVAGANDLTGLGADPANESAVGQSFAVYGSLQQMSSIKQSQSGASYRIVDVASAWDDGCVTTVGGTATYNACDSGGTTIDGTVAGTATSVDIDLKIDTGQAVIDMDGKLTFSATSLSGSLDYDTTIDAGGQTITTSYAGSYNITLDGAGCAVGGDVEVHYTVTGGAIDVWSKAEFGPNCGDVTFY